MLAAQVLRNGLEVVEYPVATRQSLTQMRGHVTRERSVLSAKQQVAPMPAASVAVHGDDDVDVIEEARERARVVRVEVGRRDVMSMGWFLDHGVE